jgi:hypothetical protein
MHQQLTLFERLVQPIRNCAYCGSMVPEAWRPVWCAHRGDGLT